jgi:hypothetical protein
MYSVPVDDDGYYTTDDDLDFDLEEKVSSVPSRSAAVPVAQQAKKAAPKAPPKKKVSSLSVFFNLLAQRACSMI